MNLHRQANLCIYQFSKQSWQMFLLTVESALWVTPRGVVAVPHSKSTGGYERILELHGKASIVELPASDFWNVLWIAFTACRSARGISTRIALQWNSYKSKKNWTTHSILIMLKTLKLHLCKWVKGYLENSMQNTRYWRNIFPCISGGL